MKHHFGSQPHFLPQVEQVPPRGLLLVLLQPLLAVLVAQTGLRFLLLNLRFYLFR